MKRQFVLDAESREEFIESAVGSFKTKLTALLNERPSLARRELVALCDSNIAIHLLASTIRAARKLPRRKEDVKPWKP